MTQASHKPPWCRTPLPTRQVLSAHQLLLNVLGPDSPAAYPLIVPLLQHSLNPNNGCEASEPTPPGTLPSRPNSHVASHAAAAPD